MNKMLVKANSLVAAVSILTMRDGRWKDRYVTNTLEDFQNTFPKGVNLSVGDTFELNLDIGVKKFQIEKFVFSSSDLEHFIESGMTKDHFSGVYFDYSAAIKLYCKEL